MNVEEKMPRDGALQHPQHYDIGGGGEAASEAGEGLIRG